MYAIRSYYEVSMLALRLKEGLLFETCEQFGMDIQQITKKAEPLEKAGLIRISSAGISITNRITSYNVCYTKLLRIFR